MFFVLLSIRLFFPFLNTILTSFKNSDTIFLLLIFIPYFNLLFLYILAVILRYIRYVRMFRTSRNIYMYINIHMITGYLTV